MPSLEDYISKQELNANKIRKSEVAFFSRCNTAQKKWFNCFVKRQILKRHKKGPSLIIFGQGNFISRFLLTNFHP